MSEPKGIQVEKNPKVKVSGQTKFNVRVDPDLFPILMKEDKWVQDEDTEWYVRGYTATDSGYEPASADDKCPGSS